LPRTNVLTAPRTRDRIIKNNNKLAKDGETNPELEFRDQGFTRPKVLFLVPTRNACLRVVNTIRDLAQPDQEENRKRFDDAFAPGEASSSSSDKFGVDKPDDFRDLFAGNDDDMFRIGVKFTRKTLKYYSQFYNSDILLASPLGLRMAIGADDGPRSKKASAKLDYDFLSSVELVVMDQADAMLMQNWEHVDYIFEHLNRQPRDAHGCDFSRVRSWYLDDRARFFRQTVVLSAFNTPELAELIRTQCHNWAGKLRVQPLSYPGLISSLGGVNIRLRQTFSRFNASSPAVDPDARFNYFKSAVLPSLARRAADAAGTLIFVPSYLDFVRLRNYLANAHEVESLSFGTLSEYADVPSASRARSHFSAGRHKLLLYTERAHHFRRYKIRGVRRAIFYGLPDNPAFYADIAGSFLAASEADGTIEPGRGVVKAIFSRFDVLKLERIVGTERVGRMVNDRGDTFDFV
jgi:U3 small nucleolar RNA-associated protein 25